MTTLKRIVLLCPFFLFFALSLIAQDEKYGLEFTSFEVIKEKRTSLNLTPTEPFSFPNGFSLSFDICFKFNATQRYGYVFRIIGLNDQLIDFVLYERKMIISYSLGRKIVECNFDEINLQYNEYFPVKITFDTENNQLNVSIKGKDTSTKAISIKDFERTNIIFGKCDSPQYQVVDVPNMGIKNIRINDINGDQLYYWPLSKHTLTGVYDELKKRFAQVDNPQWILDNHARWKKQTSFVTQSNPHICYNIDQNSIAISDREILFTYDIDKRTLTKDKLTKAVRWNNRADQMIYNPYLLNYYSYRLKTTTGRKVVLYNALTRSWDSDSSRNTTTDFQHHNRVIAPHDSCLYLFGGYGHHIYKNTINRYNFETKIWDSLAYKGDNIQPRYLGGLGVVDETRILLFGGYGSETGFQELFPRNYYDLHVVDLPTMTAKKIWELDPPKDNFVVGNSIVVDTLNKCFYALCFPQQFHNTFLFLGKFSMESPEYEIVANEIPFTFQDTDSYVDLFLDEKKDELTMIVSSHETDSTSALSIYTLSYPPLAEADLYQDTKDKNGFYPVYAGILFILLCIAAGIGYFVYKKRKKRNPYNLSSSVIPQTSDALSQKQSDEQHKNQSIFLLGGFQVRNKEGEDITGEFTPMLKQLFLIILLNTVKDGGKGISSLKLKETLWFDKSIESARNNRGVLFSKIRQIFEQVGFFNLDNLNSYWRIELGNDIYCDYCEALTLMKRLKNKTNRTHQDIRQLISIVSKGEMLPNVQVDWVDSFKANFSNDLIDLLVDIANQINSGIFPQECIDIADAIFIHDSLNEDALKLKCSALFKMGKNGLARAIYTSFIKEYSILFGSDFKHSFEQIIS